jgi:hypothetical protein
MQFLKRTLLKVDGTNDRERLHQLLKFGAGKNYWNEFVYSGVPSSPSSGHFSCRDS